GQAAAVRKLDVVAVPAVTARKLDGAVAHRVDRRAVAGLEIQPGVHPAIAEDRVAALAIARSGAARDRRQRPGPLLAHTGGLVEPAVVAPAEQLLAGFPVAENGRVEQLADLDFAGRRAFVFDDQVELVTARDPAVEVDFGSERAQILLDRAGRRAGGTRGAIEARPDHAADAQRSRIDRNRARIEHEASALTFDR